MRCRSQIIDRSETAVWLLQIRWLTCRWNWILQITIIKSKWAYRHRKVHLNLGKRSRFWWLNDCKYELILIVKSAWHDCCYNFFWNSIEVCAEKRFYIVDRRLYANINARWISWYIDFDIDNFKNFIDTTEKSY